MSIYTGYNKIIKIYKGTSEISKLYLNGSSYDINTPTMPNYTIHGSPTITGTEVSDFSTDNYLTVDNGYSGTINTMDFYFNMKFGSTVYPSSSQGYSTVLLPLTSGHGLACYMSYNGQLFFTISKSDNTVVTFLQNTISSSTFKNKDVQFRFVYDSSAAKQAALYWNPTGSWAKLKEDVLDSICFDEGFYIGNHRNLTQPFVGSIDLSKWSITINGTNWWPFTPW